MRDRGIAIGGMMGAGKSTVGRALAERLEMPFVDMDDVLEDRFGSIDAQFEDEGEAVFRQREKDLVVELADGPPAVVATGGGTWVDADSRALLNQTFDTVVLAVTLDDVRQRIALGGRARPLADRFAELLHAREVAYGDAHHHVSTAGRSVDEVVEEVLRCLA